MAEYRIKRIERAINLAYPLLATETLDADGVFSSFLSADDLDYPTGTVAVRRRSSFGELVFIDTHFVVRGTDIADSTPPVAVVSGNRLPGVPLYTVYGELVWRHAASGFHAAAEVRAAGKLYVNDQNSAFANPYTIGNLRAGFEQNSRKWRVTEFVRADNITNRAYVGSVIIAFSVPSVFLSPAKVASSEKMNTPVSRSPLNRPTRSSGREACM